MISPARLNLVFVTGSTPQIITETVFCVLQEGRFAGEVHVLTTRTGKRAIEERLLGARGRWKRFREEYPAARKVSFTARNVLVLCDAENRPLDDVRSRQDSEAAADQIASAVARLTANERPPLLASIAGGRKTMGYLLAAAMMLYGRAEDRLSHVLVYPPELEASDFFYPPRSQARSSGRRRVGRPSAKTMKVELAELPFPRLRAVAGVTAMHPRSFSSLVDDLQADLDALAQPSILVRAEEELLFCGGRRIRLPRLRFAIYRLLAERRRTGCSSSECPGCLGCHLPAAQIESVFIKQLVDRVHGRDGSSGWSARRFREELSKINRTIQGVLRGASAPYRVQARGARGARLYGISAPKSAIQIEDERRNQEEATLPDQATLP